MIVLGIFYKKMSVNQIFEKVFMITMLCSVFANPINQKESDSILKSIHGSTEMMMERERIISDFKFKLQSRLNFHHLSKINKTKIPNEMKQMLNKEIIIQNNEAQNPQQNIETIVTTLVKLNSCSNSVGKNQQRLGLNMSHLNNEDIKNVKLILPLRQWHFLPKYQKSLQYHMSVNGVVNITLNFSQINVNSNSVVVDCKEIFDTLLSDDDEFKKVKKSFPWTVSIVGPPNMKAVDELFDLDKVVLELQYKNTQRLSRNRRSLNNCELNQFFCCAEKLVVSIEDLGYSDFILAPREFTINYCRGDCNNYIKYSSNHAKAIHFSRKKVRFCCVPYSYQNVTLMYLNQNNTIAVVTFNDLIASTCGCL